MPTPDSLFAFFSIRQLSSAPVLTKTLASLGNFAAFIAAFVLVCAGIGAVLPERKVAFVSQKLEWLAEHGDEYDVLFIGSSRIYRQLVPEVFDTEMTSAGHPVRSFNAGVDAMRPPEDTYFLEKILERRTKPLRFVVVERNQIRLRMSLKHQDTLRAVYWHDNARMKQMLEAVSHGPLFAEQKKRTWGKRWKKIEEAWPDFSDYTGYWIWRSTNRGRGHDLLADWLKVIPLSVSLSPYLGNRMDGFVPCNEAVMSAVQIAEYESLLTAMRSDSTPRNADDMLSLDELRVKKRLIERAGAQMVLVVPPSYEGNIFPPKDGQGMSPVLDFSDPEKYPELFSVEHRFDKDHVNKAGAQIYTHLIARELLKFLKKETR